MGSTMDLLPTFSKMAGAPIPQDRIIDGVDLSLTLKNLDPSPRNSMIYYRGSELFAARLGDYKAHFITQGAYGINGDRIDHETPQLYNLSHDPSENYEIGADHPEVIEQIQAMVNEHKSKMVMGKDQLVDRGN
jgi:arylsulfatase A-like enzyme